MGDAVVDASILIAIVRNEAIDEQAQSVVSRGVISAVNLAEFHSKLASWGIRPADGVVALLASLQRVEPFTAEQAEQAGRLLPLTKHAGLSLGDRACLALALELGVPAYTVDKSWLRVDVGCEIICLR